MILPKNEPRKLGSTNKKKLYLYGTSFSGKTTFASQFPNALMLNTDGNIRFVTTPYVPIANNVTVEGRLTKTKLAWQVFKDVIAELEKKDNTFETIIVDLVEDTYEHCRIYCYDKLGIEHESDNSFKAWDFVRTEFLSTIKRLINLDYENIILISHEDTSKDITKKGGDKITAIRPNINEKIALKLAGMVDIVARVVIEDNVRKLNFKSDNVIFGGGRLKLSTTEIPLDYDALMQVYENSTENVGNVRTVQPQVKEEPKPVPVEEVVEEPITPVVEETIEPITEVVEEVVVETVVEEQPRRRRRMNLED